MKKIIVLSSLLVLCFFTLFSNVEATIIGGSGPAGFGSDDGTTEFLPSGGAYSLELLDFGGDNGFLTSFGFYFTSDPSSYIGIFGPEDQDPNPADSAYQTAIIDFTLGKVYDVDDPNYLTDPDTALQDTFTPSTGNIGFVSFIDLSSIPLGIHFLHTDPALNDGGIDAAATFPLLTEPSTYLIGFELFNPAINDFQTINVNVVGGINSIPEPGTLLLIGSGLIGVAAMRRNKK